MKILDIIRGTTVDGPGFRTSIYMAGCNHQCPGCHNPQSWDFDAGVDMSLNEIMDVVREEDFDVTLSGGDPLYHPKEVAAIASEVHKLGHTVWLYTGFTYEYIQSNATLLEALKDVDVIVDGPFIADMRDPDLPFRGSSNQRIIHLNA